MKSIFAITLACGILATGTTAHAQSYQDPYADPYARSYQSGHAASVAGPYAGIQLGYEEVATIDLPTIGGNGTELNVEGAMFGGYLGYNVPLGDSVVLGVEGSVNFGTDQIDNDYTVAGHLGVAFAENSMVFVRGGYQWVDLDVADLTQELLGRPLTPAELNAANAQNDTADGVLIGAGVQFGLGRNAHLRATIDTIEFDTYRVGAGLGIKF